METFKFCHLPQIGYDNVLQMDSISLDTFLDNFQTRYENGIFYTYIGEVCISVNPNRTNMNIYGPEYMDIYYDKQLYSMPPHIFAIADSAYRETFVKNNNSCIIITGESGSGKTEASKLLLLYITNIFRKQELFTLKKITNVEDTILYSNCILESFGNARTQRNINSSRFGKYIEISFSSEKCLKAYKDLIIDNERHHSYGMIHSFMLEKSRVIEQQTCERNFHSFYQLLASLDSMPTGHFRDILDSLHLVNDVRSYEYLRLSKQSVITEQDQINFHQLLNAFQKVGFSTFDIATIYRILATILHLGNIRFQLNKETDDCSKDVDFDFSRYLEKDSIQSLNAVCQLLSIDCKSALRTLCCRKICIRQDVVFKMYDHDEAIYGRDALAKSLYERLFKFILKRINNSLQKGKPEVTESSEVTVRTIGILDIYGFEVFNCRANGFEQFLINYCNEKLHQLFVDTILKKEQDLYSMEDIDWKMVEFNNNIAICNLLDQPHKGIFALLDEACTSGQQYTDRSLLSAFNLKFANNSHFQTRVLYPALKHLSPETDFIIRHYAGDVHYSIEGFLDKNTDQLYNDYRQLIYASSDSLIREIMRIDICNESLSKKRPMTAGLEFRRSMNDSINRLSQNQQFYVRCIKPNDNLNDNRFVKDKVRHQIQYLGLVESAHVRKAGFWRQMSYLSFVNRYQMLIPDIGNFGDKDDGDQRKLYMPICRSIIQQTENDFDNSKVAFGKTIIFLRDPKLIDSLEGRRMEVFAKLTLEIQAFGRGFLARKAYQRLKLCRKLFDQFYQIKTYELVNELLKHLDQYGKQYYQDCSSVPMQFLEYYHLEPLKWPHKMLKLSPIFCNNKIFNNSLPELALYLNNCLIMLKFPHEYWIEKLLRIDAHNIFANNKLEWGQTRRRWLGNYQIFPNECYHYIQFAELLTRQWKRLGNVLFSSYILKTNSLNWDRIYSIVVGENAIYKVDVPSMTCTQWISIFDIHSISITPGKDQLVVIHNKSPNNDLVFSFCTLKESLLGISTTQLSIECGSGGINVHSAKVGELVTILHNQYYKLTECTFPIYFRKEIEFKFDNKPQTIEVFDCDVESNYGSLLDRFLFRLRSFFTLKNFRYMYLGISNNRDRVNSDRLAKRVEFRKVSNRNFILICD